MSVCPQCGAEIDHLVYQAYELQKADFYIFKTNVEYSSWDSLGDIAGNPEYRCPICDEVLFHGEDEAEKFLRGEK